MKFITRIFALMLLIAPIGAMADTPLSGTAGSNLTAYHGNMGAINNNQWNTMTNARSAPSADFGNCNALILRCAQPKCSGCTTMDIAYPIVSGCVMSNNECKGHGEALIQYIAAQIVSNNTNKASNAAAEAQAAASAQAAAQSEAQMQQLQMQMQQMQNQMSQQSAQSAAAVEAALAEQRQLAEQQAAELAAANAAAAPATQVANAVEHGVSADVLAREQISGQILTQLENAEVALNTLKKTMQTAFDYAGCDANGSNCTGPARAKAFKQKAGEFFDPYENVLDEVYDALILAQSLGVDITDIYMMLNGTCNVWGKYLCGAGQTMHYQAQNSSLPGYCDPKTGRSNSGTQCKSGQVVPMNDGGCQLIQMLTSNDEVQQNWLYPEQGTNGADVRVGCASEALDNSTLFRSRKKQASIDIETLQRIIEQDAPNVLGRGKSVNPDFIKYCATGDTDALQKAVNLKKLPDKVCVSDDDLEKLASNYPITSSSATSKALDCTNPSLANTDQCLCENTGGLWLYTGCNCGSSYQKYNESTKKCEMSVLANSGGIGSMATNAVKSAMSVSLSNSGSSKSPLQIACETGGSGFWYDNKCTCKSGKAPNYLGYCS